MNAPKKRISLARGIKRCSQILNHAVYWIVVGALVVSIAGALIFVVYPFYPNLPDYFPFNFSAEVTDDSPGVSATPTTPQRSASGCRTNACNREAWAILRATNTSFHPCDDFYLYVCSNWMSQKRHSPHGAKTSVDDTLLFLYSELMAKLLRVEHQSVPTVKLFFENCVRPPSALFRHVLNTFFYLIGFQDWPYYRTTASKLSSKEVSAKIGAVYRHLGLDSLFHFSTLEVPSGNKFYPVVGEPYLLIGEFQGPLRTYEFLTDAFRMLMGWLDKFADTDVASLEVGLAQRKVLFSKWYECTILLKHCEAIQITNLPSNKLFSWDIVLERAFGERLLDEAKGEIKMPSQNYLLTFGDLATLPKKSDILNYLVFRVAMALSPFLPNSTVRNHLASIAYATHPEFATFLPFTHYCVRLLDKFEPYIPMLLAYDKGVNRVGYSTLQELLLSDLKQFFQHYIASDTRFYGAFKDSLLKRLSRISWEPLVPQKLFDKEFRARYLAKMYTGNPVKPLSAFYYYWFKSAVKRKYWTMSDKYEHLKTGWKGGFLRTYPSLYPPFTHLEVPLPVFDFRISSDPSVRLLHVPRVAARIYRSLYQYVYSWAYNFYFRTSATDPVSVLENARGCLQWDLASMPSPFTNTSLNAEASSLSNVFDALAIRPAFMAFMEQAVKNGSQFWMERAPQFTAAQLFFIYYARGYCECNNPTFLEKMMKQGEESPAWYRVNAPLRHFGEFANAFGCRKGSFMNPSQQCL